MNREDNPFKFIKCLECKDTPESLICFTTDVYICITCIKQAIIVDSASQKSLNINTAIPDDGLTPVEKIKQLRLATGLGLMECRSLLVRYNWDLAVALSNAQYSGTPMRRYHTTM